MDNISVIIDFEGFSSREHGYIYRQLAWISMDEEDEHLVDIFSPDIPYSSLNRRDQFQVRWEKENLHGLYLITRPTRNTSINIQGLQRYLTSLWDTYEGVFAFKGGSIEKSMLQSIRVPFIDLEAEGCPRARDINVSCSHHLNFLNHCPLCEVNCYKNFVTNRL